MRNIRIGKDILVRWAILTNGEAKPLEGRDLRLEIRDYYMNTKVLTFSIEDVNRIVTTVYGKEQSVTGEHTFTLWENYGKTGQTVVDSCDGFNLVSTTCEEKDSGNGLDTETVDLATASLDVITSSEPSPDPGGDYLTKAEAEETYQTINDEALQTEDKTVVGAINEVKGIAEKGGSSGIPDAPKDGKTLTIPCDTAIALLGQLEMYALKCYNKTAEHKANVQALTTAEQVKAYDYTTGYPEKLQLTF